jgi:hypothetical protein
MLFGPLMTKQKIDFFAKCQYLLLKYHPKSRFIVTYEKIEEKLSFFKSLIETYSGAFLETDSMCLLYNRVSIQNPNDVIEEYKNAKNSCYIQEGNCISISFLVADSTPENFKEFIKIFENIEYVMFLRGEKVAILPRDLFLSKANEVVSKRDYLLS